MWAAKPLPQLIQKTVGAEASGRPWRRLLSCWYFVISFFSSFLCEWFASTVVDLVSRVSRAMCVPVGCLLTTSLYRSRFPLANSTQNTAFGSLLSFILVKYPIQRSWETVRVASMLDIWARLKTSIFGMWSFYKFRRISRRCRRCTWESCPKWRR